MRTILFLLAFTATAFTHAQNAKPKRPPQMNSNRVVKLIYGFPKWNKDAKKIDSASVFMREGNSGKIVQIYLEETAPDSSVFSGLYSLSWDKIDEIAPEFYIPPQEDFSGEKGVKQLVDLIEKKQLKRHPFILRKTKEGFQTIEVFDNKEQAMVAMKAYRAEQAVIELMKKKYPPEASLDAAKLAKDLEEKKLAAAAMADRARLDQLESRRILDKTSEFKGLTFEEQQKRKAKAQQLAQEAIAFYMQQKYPEAKIKFEESVGLDPENKAYYFQFGVTLYKTEEFNRSVVVLENANGPDVNVAERDYYLALNHFRLKEYSVSFQYFQKVRDLNIKDLSASSEFYMGIIMFEQKKYVDAQPLFQHVLDSSDDPRLDEKAEQYLELILRIQQYEQERSRKWMLNGTLGYSYDSNMLSVSPGSLSSGSASDLAGWKTLMMGTLKYRPIYEADHEFAAQLDLTYTYTLDQSLKFKSTLHNTDATIAALTLPYTFKTVIHGKGAKLDLIPGYETTYMNVEEDTNKEILNSYILNSHNMVVLSDDWFANFNLEMRKDNSKLASSTGDDDASAIKVKLDWSNMFFMNKEKNKIVMSDLAYTINEAQGSNVDSNRVDMSGTYIAQWYWEMTYNTKIAYYRLNYPAKSDNRADNNFALTAGLSKKLNETWSSGLTANYTINASNVDANSYNKYSLMLTLSAGQAF